MNNSGLIAEICATKEQDLVRRLREGVGAVRFVMGTHFTKDEIPFLTTIYFPYLIKRGCHIHRESKPNDCPCDALCEHSTEGAYVVYLKK